MKSVTNLPTLLILGGTSEAYVLAENLVGEGFQDDFRILTSLRGSTRNPRIPAGEQRVGGFGGPQGLADFLKGEKVFRVIDATHPFAEQISRHASIACSQTRIPLIHMERPSWKPQSRDRWVFHVDLQSTAQWLTRNPSRVFLTSGHRGLEVFRICHGSFFLIRTVEPARLPEPFLPAENLIARGPFSLEQEIELMRSHSISILVSKNSGGQALRPKLLAARELEITVLMVQRPDLPEGRRAEGVEQVIDWLRS